MTKTPQQLMIDLYCKVLGKKYYYYFNRKDDVKLTNLENSNEIIQIEHDRARMEKNKCQNQEH